MQLPRSLPYKIQEIKRWGNSKEIWDRAAASPQMCHLHSTGKMLGIRCFRPCKCVSWQQWPWKFDRMGFSFCQLNPCHSRLPLMSLISSFSQATVKDLYVCTVVIISDLFSSLCLVLIILHMLQLGCAPRRLTPRKSQQFHYQFLICIAFFDIVSSIPFQLLLNTEVYNGNINCKLHLWLEKRLLGRPKWLLNGHVFLWTVTLAQAAGRIGHSTLARPTLKGMSPEQPSWLVLCQLDTR